MSARLIGPYEQLAEARAANAALQERLRVVEAGLAAAREALEQIAPGGWVETIETARELAREVLAALVPDTERTEQ